jgi:hypothetical protein
VIRLAPGAYTMAAGSKIKPYIGIIGSGKEHTSITTTGGATIVDFTGSTSRVLLQDLRISGSSGLTADKTGATGGAWLGLFRCSVSGPVTYAGTGSGNDFFEAHQCFFHGSSFTISGVSSIVDNCNFYGTLTVNSTGATAVDAYGYYFLWSMQACYVAGNLTVTAAASKPAGFQIFDTKGDGNWTFTGTAALDLYVDSATGVFAGNTVSQSGTVTTYRYGHPNFIYYNAVSASWAATSPTNMKDALDRMAALLKTLNGGVAIP